MGHRRPKRSPEPLPNTFRGRLSFEVTLLRIRRPHNFKKAEKPTSVSTCHPKGGDPNLERTNSTRGGYPSLLTPRPTSWGYQEAVEGEREECAVAAKRRGGRGSAGGRTIRSTWNSHHESPQHPGGCTATPFGGLMAAREKAGRSPTPPLGANNHHCKDSQSRICSRCEF